MAQERYYGVFYKSELSKDWELWCNDAGVITSQTPHNARRSFSGPKNRSKSQLEVEIVDVTLLVEKGLCKISPSRYD